MFNLDRKFVHPFIDKKQYKYICYHIYNNIGHFSTPLPDYKYNKITKPTKFQLVFLVWLNRSWFTSLFAEYNHWSACLTVFILAAPYIPHTTWLPSLALCEADFWPNIYFSAFTWQEQNEPFVTLDKTVKTMLEVFIKETIQYWVGKDRAHGKQMTNCEYD